MNFVGVDLSFDCGKHSYFFHLHIVPLIPKIVSCSYCVSLVDLEGSTDTGLETIGDGIDHDER